MPSKIARKKPTHLVTKGDNFQLIKGITPTYEKHLHEAGVRTYEKLSLLSSKEIFALLKRPSHLSMKNINEMDWSGQARELIEANPIPDTRQTTIETDNPHYRNEGFAVDVFVDEQQQIYSTHVLHVKSGESDEWKGWSGEKLYQFMQNFGINLLSGENNTIAVQTQKVSTEPAPNVAVNQLPVEKTVPKQPVQSVSLRKLEMLPAHGPTASIILHSGEPFAIRLGVEYSDELIQAAPPTSSTDCEFAALITAKQFGTSQRLELGAMQGAFKSNEEAIVLDIPRQQLQPGTYRLEAAVKFSLPKNKSLAQPESATTVSKIIQVL